MFITSPVGAVAKYCTECVCVCVCVPVCLFTMISPESHARSLPNFCACYTSGRDSVLLRQGDDIPRGQLGSIQKTAKPIEMPFGMVRGLGPRNSVLRWGDGPRNMCPTSLTPLTGPCSGVHKIGADASTLDCKRWKRQTLQR